MQRTQIYLPQELKTSVAKIAAQQGVSMADVIRQVLAREVAAQPEPTGNPLTTVAALKLTGPTDLSTTYKTNLYGS